MEFVKVLLVTLFCAVIPMAVCLLTAGTYQAAVWFGFPHPVPALIAVTTLFMAVFGFFGAMDGS